MSESIVDFDRRCRDCRGSVPAGTPGQVVLGRFLCDQCAPIIVTTEPRRE